MPNGEMPEGFTPPEKPQGDIQQFPGNIADMENFTRPENMNGEQPPQMPNDEQPQGERPQMPNNMGEMGMTNGENSTTFIIIKGGNQFANVSPIATK